MPAPVILEEMAEPTNRQQAGAKEFLLYAGGVATVLLALAIVIAVTRSGGGGSRGNAGATSTTIGNVDRSSSSTTTSKPKKIFPTDRVAYITGDGRVLSGVGAAQPVQVGDGAAVNAQGQGSMAVSPTGDLIAYIRSDGALVTVPVEGGEARVLATDSWLSAVGSSSFIAWDPTSTRIAYLAKGTIDMVEPRPEKPDPPSVFGAFLVPLPEGHLGAVIKIVDRDGKVVNRIGDPSLRSMTGITYSSTDDLILVESKIPGEEQPYTLATANSQLPEVQGSVLSADEPAFSPDGNFIVVVGPRPGGRELLRLSTESLSRAVLTSDKEICNPSVSPDNTRIVYGAGERCAKLMLISSRGGTPVEITPPKRPGQTFATSRVQWTQDGHFVVFPDCRIRDASTSCGGPVVFLDPDRSVLINGVAAGTVGTVSRPLIEDMTVHLAMQGPIAYKGTFLVDANAEAQLTDVSGAGSVVDVVLKEKNRSLAVKVDVDESRKFSSGTMTLIDPEAGINRTFVITGAASLIGMRVATVSGIWISTADLPFATGEFRISVVRGA